MRAVWFLLGGVALGGCTLIDQTTFAPSPEEQPAAPQTPAAAAQVDTRTPLIVVGYDTPSPHFQEPLRFAVHQAETRVPGVQYDVIAMMPAGGDLALSQRNATDIMRAIMAQGVPAGRIHLGLRTAPAGTPRQVRVYVRQNT